MTSLKSIAAEAPESKRVPHDLIVMLIVVYLFWFITTPYNSNRLAFLATIRFEKILAIVLIGLTLVMGRFSQLFSVIGLLVFALFGVMLLAFVFSSYPNFGKSVHWADNYWKKMVFFAIVLAGVRNAQQLDRLLKGLVCISVFYQLYSWFDFLRGGSFVYQQGMKRMVGTWSEWGYGAANGYALLSVFALPCIYHWYKTTSRRSTQILMVGFGLLSMLSVAFSGGRGVLLSSGVYLLLTFRKSLLKPKIFIALGLCGICSIPLLPENIKHRYWDLMLNPASSEEVELSKTDQIALASGSGRLEGMKNGFRLGFRNPLLGFGPGTSAFAVYDVLDIGDGVNFLELHNLYGQIVAETGFTGFLVWLIIISAIFWKLWRLQQVFGPSTNGYSLCSAIMGGLCIMLCYGMFSHTFYDWRWLFLFGCAGVLMQFTLDDFAYESYAMGQEDEEFEDDDFEQPAD